MIECLSKDANNQELISYSEESLELKNSENNFDFLNDIQFNFDNLYPTENEVSVANLNTASAPIAEQNQPKASLKEKKTLITNWDFLSDDEEDNDLQFMSKKNEHSDDELSSCKKTRLSFSPIQNVDDTLYWIKSQSNASSDLFENRELTLTGI